ncbi:alpha-amylase family glycosyl hydrolase [Antarcticibacterium flavum]|nr:alpha-amylase family glycosyl hydrolase [Antarcticibacterium flavum]
MIDACHKKGIAVILDAVYNHMGPEGNYLSSTALTLLKIPDTLGSST